MDDDNVTTEPSIQNVRSSLGLVYTECLRQCCNVDSDIALNKSLKFLNKPTNCSKNGQQPQFIRYDTSVDAEVQNPSLTLSENGPLQAVKSLHDVDRNKTTNPSWATKTAQKRHQTFFRVLAFL